MKMTLIFLVSCLLSITSSLAVAAATAETATAAKAKAAEKAAEDDADKAVAEADAAAAEAAKAAKLAKAKAEAAVKQAKEKAITAKKAIAAAAKTGAKSCDEWKDERASKTSAGLSVTWLSGFLAGIVVSKNQDFLKGTSTQSLYSSIDSYCEAHPFEFISDAGIYVYLELARKKGLAQ
jgi:membrane protein involved in colicin uptake